MNGKKRKNKTALLLDVMVWNADKEPSGFWTDDYEGCGNPKIFPEFEAGLKHGKYVHKDPYLCPWNTAVLYGGGHGNINTGKSICFQRIYVSGMYPDGDGFEGKESRLY